ncbi:Rho guanine nucleotide exchange factor [Paramarasmius palmivorus]|uniref:Rho guanine nucleotide exchange factor n=1 Tax=Paramarasmius palmivorus TaxID=297713 RepID=A0AAW0ECJ0_9AGAR
MIDIEREQKRIQLIFANKLEYRDLIDQKGDLAQSILDLLQLEFLREAIVWRQFKHPNVLPFLGLYYIDEHRERLSLVSPWMKNGNLTQFLARQPQYVNRPMLVSSTIQFMFRVLHTPQMYDVVAGLSYLHKLKIIHGDLKGANILLTPHGRACIADFGLSRVAADSQLFTTSSLQPKGTTRWMAPELLMGGKSTSLESDVYAYGCVCYEIFTARAPFHELPNDAAVAIHILQGFRPARPRDLPELEDSIWLMMEACWDADASARPKASDLMRLVADMPSTKGIGLASDWDDAILTGVWDNVQTPQIDPALTEYLQQVEKQRRKSSSSERQLHQIDTSMGVSNVRNSRPLPPTPVAEPPHTLGSRTNSYTKLRTSMKKTNLLRNTGIDLGLHSDSEDEDSAAYDSWDDDTTTAKGNQSEQEELDSDGEEYGSSRLEYVPLFPGTETDIQKAGTYNSIVDFPELMGRQIPLTAIKDSLIHSGNLVQSRLNRWISKTVLLFKDYLVRANMHEKDGIPMPVDLLSIVSFTDPPTRGSKGLISKDSRVRDRQDSGECDLYPFKLHLKGRFGGFQTFYTDSFQSRMEWYTKLKEAMAMRESEGRMNRLYDIEMLSGIDSFVTESTANVPLAEEHRQNEPFTGKVTCAVPIPMPDGRSLLAIGCDEGVWVTNSPVSGDTATFRRVLPLKKVKQCGVLEEHGLFLALAEKTILAYRLTALDPLVQNKQDAPSHIVCSDVEFFGRGSLNGRTFLIYMKRKGSDSVFCVVEPVGIPERKVKADPFQPFKEFYLTTSAYGLCFLGDKIAVLCKKGFELLDPTKSLQSIVFPQIKDPRLMNWALHCDSSQPIGLFKCNEEEYLLCYNDIGLYVNAYGEPSRTASLIEWEGSAQRVVFHPPHIVLFDTRFMEIRHVQTGRLVQIIGGNDIYWLWDAHETPSSITLGSGASCVLGVMNASRAEIESVQVFGLQPVSRSENVSHSD